MYFKNIIYLLTTITGLYSIGYTHTYVIDINDTICLLNDVDPDKTAKVVNGQLVAQNIFLKSAPDISLEMYIKEFIKDKKSQRQAYGDLVEKADDLLRNDLISQQSLEQIPILSKKYAEARDKINNLEDGNLFNSIYKFINHIIIHDSQAAFVIQSFGKEIKLVLEALHKRFQDRLYVEMEIANFDEHDHLNFQGHIYDNPQAIQKLLKPLTIRGWKNNYAAGGKKILFFQDEPQEFKKTYFFDDNADQFAKVVYNSKVLTQKKGLCFAKPYIFNVDTAQALTDENYFIDLLQQKISVLSYNIELSESSTEPRLWSQQAPAVYAKLLQHDLLLLQDVSHNQFMDIQKALPDYTYVGVNSVTGGSLNEEADNHVKGMVIGFNSSMFAMANQSPINRWFSDTPTWSGTKVWNKWQMQFAKLLQRILLIHKPTQSSIAVYNNHFSHENDPEKIINPRFEAAKIETALMKQDMEHNFFIISGGNRNLHWLRDKDVLNVYREVAGLTEANTEGPNTTLLDYNPQINPTKDGQFVDNMALDRIYYSNDLTLHQAVLRSSSCDANSYFNDCFNHEDQSNTSIFASRHSSVSVHLSIKQLYNKEKK